MMAAMSRFTSSDLMEGMGIVDEIASYEIAEKIAEEEKTISKINTQILAALSNAVGEDWGEFTHEAEDYFVQINELDEKPGFIRVDICTAEPNSAFEDKLTNAGWLQEPDVLDTWFSSALWPFSTLGWPDETEELKFYYPTNLLVTSRDIITLWVSRMVMMGLYNVNDIPFSDVFIHGKILDGKGETMSKSKGNGIDPLDIIATYGADAMRFSLAQMTTESQDMRMHVKKDEKGKNISEKFDIGRNFCNKLWNASRFAMMNLEGVDAEQFDEDQMTITDRWLLSRLTDTINDVTSLLGEYKYNEPLMCLYRFFWNDLCDWYLEWAKPRFQNEQQKQTAQNVLALALDQCLRLMHPFIPFMTEGIFQHLKELAPVRKLNDFAKASDSEALINAQWPKPLEQFENPEAEEKISIIQSVIRSMREIRSQYNVAPSKKLTAAVTGPVDVIEIIDENSELICKLAGMDSLTIAETVEHSKTAASAIVNELEVFVNDVIDPQEEIKRLEKQKDQILKGITPLEKKLANENFLERAKPEVVMQSRERLAELQEQFNTLENRIKEIKNM